MSRFEVFVYQFNPKLDAPELLPFEEVKEEKEKIMANKNSVFSEYLGKISFTHRQASLNYKEVYQDGELFIFKLASKKSIILEKNFKKEIEDTYPSSYVIIFNNPDYQRILIEDRKEAFTDTSVLAGILCKSFNKHLNKFSLDITIKKEYYACEFWDIVKENPNLIQMLRFEFDYPNLPRVNDYICSALKSISNEANSNKTKLELNAGNGALQMNEEKGYIPDLVKGAAQGGNPVTIKIKGLRKYKKTGSREKRLDIDELELNGDNAESLKEIIRSIDE